MEAGFKGSFIEPSLGPKMELYGLLACPDSEHSLSQSASWGLVRATMFCWGSDMSTIHVNGYICFSYMCIYIYIHTYEYTFTYVYIYIYIYGGCH